MAVRVDVNKNTQVPGLPGGKGAGTQDFTIDEAGILAFEQNAVQLPSSDIPAPNKINWAGSSYSGADIKVVVHLYGDLDNDLELLRLQQELDFYAELKTAYATLDAADLDTALRTQFYLSTREMVTQRLFAVQDSRVIDHIVRFLDTYRGTPAVTSGTRLTRETRLREGLQNNRNDVERVVDFYGVKLDKLRRLQANSHSTFTLATLQTISIQTHREKAPVRALGFADVKGFTRGPRTIAGSMIFTMFNEHALAGLIRAMGKVSNRYEGSGGRREDNLKMLLSDQLPPVDITIVFANEYGSLSRGALYGVEFMNSGITLSIEDIITEDVVQFVARDFDPIIAHGNIGLSRDQRGMHFDTDGLGTDGSSLLFSSKDEYANYLDKLKVRRSLRNR
jgi:hypothetical protein